MPSLSKILTSIWPKRAKEPDAAKTRNHRPSGRPAPAAESDSRSSSGSLAQDRDSFKAHPPVSTVDRPPTSHPPTGLPVIPATHNAPPPNGMIANTVANSSMKMPQKPMLTNRDVDDPQDPSGFLAHAHDFIMNNPIMIDAANDNFMETFARHIIQGAELDSSARDPPPRCHPGTRVEIVNRMRSRARNPTKRVQWLVGPAGVGKSAIMQTVAELEEEDSALFAALFFSAPNGRNDPSRVIITLAYQLALQDKAYCQHIRSKAKANPTLWSKSTGVQFAEFIIKPFTTMQIYTGSKPLLMFIDGLDECKGQQEQIHILSLIFNFTTRYPQAPLLWVIASRPEAHITEYLKPLTFYDKEEVSVDSTDACQDVKRFLRAEFEKIRISNSWLKSRYRQWPPENQLTKLLAATLGLFAYAEIAARFIGDLGAGDPISRLQVILDLIDGSPQFLSMSDTKAVWPLAHLDILYQYILSQVNPDNIPRVEEILAYVIFSQSGDLMMTQRYLAFMCNWIGMLPNVMYSALLQLHSVVYVPLPNESFRQFLRIYHRSFSDFILDPQRSGLSIGTREDELHRHFLRSARILGDIPYPAVNNPKANIILSWPRNEIDLQHHLYLIASYAFKTMSSLPAIYLPQIAHALKVSRWDIDEVISVKQCVYRHLFSNTHSELVELLREDGAFQDIPVHLLDLKVIRKRQPTIGKGYDFHSWTSSVSNSYLNVFEKLVSRLEEAQVHAPHDLVRVFIGTRFVGIVEFQASTVAEGSPKPEVFYFMYDFSTIYQGLKELRVREGENGSQR